MLGTKNLGDILSERESIAHELHELLFEATEPWGVQVERVEVRNVLAHITILALMSTHGASNWNGLRSEMLEALADTNTRSVESGSHPALRI